MDHVYWVAVAGPGTVLRGHVLATSPSQAIDRGMRRWSLTPEIVAEWPGQLTATRVNVSRTLWETLRAQVPEEEKS